VAERTLNHFSLFSFTDAFWAMPAPERAGFYRQWSAGLKDVAPRADVYQVFPARADSDLLVWSALPADSNTAAADFFRCFGRTINPHRHLLQPTSTLWGFTKPSQYARGASAQEIDPFAEERQPYLIVYPFVKTKDWYLMSRDSRQGMMNEHMRIGHQYPAIKQLLLYSFGLQDQEFVVVYSTEDLVLFSDLVNELRGADGRRYTERDTPNFTAVYCPPEEALSLWGEAR
jgi:chlorite dismutase